MPHLVKMDKRQRKNGLVVVAAEVQNSSPEAIKAFAKDQKMKMTVTQGISGPRVGGNGIPRALVFNGGGKLVYAGHPMDGNFEKTVKRSLKTREADAAAAGVAGGGSDKPEVKTERVWTNSEGKEITASALAVKGDSVKLRLENGRVVTYKIAELSADDQELLKGFDN